jgi:hypothetical protein
MEQEGEHYDESSEAEEKLHDERYAFGSEPLCGLVTEHGLRLRYIAGSSPAF